MTAQLIVKTDSKVKDLAMKMAKSQGIHLSTVINMFLVNYVKGFYRVDLVNTNTAHDMDVSIEPLFQDPEIISKANDLSQYLQDKDL